jgi:hypothetical protein
VSDEVFVVKGVTKRSSTFSSKISVLWPLIGRRSLRDEDVILDTNVLINRWRQRLSVFKEKGWPDIQGTGKLQFARNCPPAGVVSFGEKTCRPCRLSAVCPWCYMRNVEKVFNKLAVSLPNRGSLRTTGLRLLEISGRMLLKRRHAGKYISGHLLEWADVPKRLLTRLKPLGAYRSVSLDPKVVEGQISGWRFSYRILAIVPEGWEIPAWLDNGKRKVRLTYVQSKKRLINIVGRTCRYPVGLLHGDAQMAINSLNARKGKRLSEFTGCLRSSGVSHDKQEAGA